MTKIQQRLNNLCEAWRRPFGVAKGAANTPTLAAAHYAQRGAGIIETVIGLGIMLTTIAIAGAAYMQHVYARKLAASSAAGQDVSATFSSAMMTTFHNYIAQGQCNNTNLLMNANLGANTGNLAITTVSGPPSAPGGNIPQDFQQALSRCAATGVPTGSNITQVYGCYLFTPAAAAKSQSSANAFFQSRLAFVEFTGLIQNFATASPATCGAAGAGVTGYGIAGYYGLHWVVNNGNNPIYKSKYGVLYSGL